MMHDVKQPLRLVGGKFMRGDIEEAPQIGNPEQIALLRRIEREVSKREQKAREGRLDVGISVKNIRYDAVCELTCICGEPIRETVDYCTADFLYDLEDPDDFDGDEITCRVCGRRYEINGGYAKVLTRCKQNC